MDNKFKIDRGIFMPMGIGVLSMLGICIILSILYLNKPQTELPVETTATRFKYLFLGTETLTPEFTQTAEPETETPTPEEEPTASVTPVPISTATKKARPAQATVSPTIANTPGPTATPTLDEARVLAAGKYDDADSHLEYDGDWTSELFISGAYRETLYVSLEVDSTVSFTFIGKQVIIGYKGDSDFGVVAIKIDGNESTFNQSSGSEWISSPLGQGNHSVVIRHKSGEVVNVDYVQILE